VAALGALIAAIGAAGCSGGGTAGPPGPALGFNEDWQSLSPNRDASGDPFALARALGTSVARYPLAWEKVGLAGSKLGGPCSERPGRWATYDAVYHRLTGSTACTHEPAAATAIAPLPVVVGAPPPHGRRCGSRAKTPIVADGAAANGAWGRFVENVADRYPLAKGIEIWNEPNLDPFWGDCPLDPDRYAKLLEFAHGGIERSSHPGIPIVLASLSSIEDDTPGNWLTYLRAVFAAPRLRAPVPSLFDVMGLHPYRSDRDAADNRGFAEAVRRDIDLARGFLASHGAGDKPVWVTEVGVSTGARLGNPKRVAGAELQAAELRDIYEAVRDHGVPVMVVYRLIDSSHPGEAPGYGVLTSNFQKKPAYSCLAQLRGLAGSCP
jgi:hypothetical protein